MLFICIICVFCFHFRFAAVRSAVLGWQYPVNPTTRALTTGPQLCLASFGSR